MIDLDKLRGKKGPPPKREYLLSILLIAAAIYAVLQCHWLTWLIYCGAASLTLSIAYSAALAMLVRNANLSIPRRLQALLVLLIALFGGLVFGIVGMVAADFVRLILLDVSKPAGVRSLAGMFAAVSLGVYFHHFKTGMRGVYGSAEILTAVVVVWFTAYIGPSAAPSVPLFILAVVSAAFLVSQGIENIKASLAGTEDVFVALVLDVFAPRKAAPRT